MRTSAGTVTVDGVRLAYLDHLPDGPADPTPVVALHGLASGSRTWDRFAGTLATRERRTVALDARGHGRSSRSGDYSFATMRDDVLAVLDRLGLWQVDLVGHSLGGHIATLVAMHAPHRVRRLLLEDTPPPPADDVTVPAVGGFGLFRFGSVMLLTRARQFDVRMSAPVITQLRTPDPAWWQHLDKLTMPVLLVRGGRRSHVPGAQIALVAEALPNCRMVTIENAKHRIHSQYLAEFIRVAIPFITSPTPRR